MSLQEELGEDVKQKINNAQQLYSLIQNFIGGKKSQPQQTNSDAADVAAENSSQKIPQETLSEAIQEEAPLSVGNEAFSFSGQKTDLCYFSRCDAMPVEAIANISDPKLREAVLDNFKKACDSGLVSLDYENNTIVITDKGKQEISEPRFVEAARKDQIKAYNKAVNNAMNQACGENEVQMAAELTGKCGNDFTYFYHADSMDLSFLKSHPDRETAEKVARNLEKWEKSGFVKIEGNTAAITKKGKNVLADSEFKQKVSPISEKPLASLGGVPGKITAVTKKVVQAAQTVQQTANAMSRQ